MPFIVNGLKLNKPIYEGVVLNAIHVWLQNHWTGTANASPSTLSQDGQLVATNLFPTMLPTGFNPDRTSVTQTADGFTITTNTTYTGDGDDHDLYAVNTVAGETYHFHAETTNVLTTTLPDLSIWVNGGINVPNTYLLSPSVIDRDIPVTIGLSQFAFKCGMTAGDHITWRRIGLYTAADWKAMQARGVTWFNGDTYTRSRSNN